MNYNFKFSLPVYINATVLFCFLKINARSRNTPIYEKEKRTPRLKTIVCRSHLTLSHVGLEATTLSATESDYRLKHNLLCKYNY